MATEITIQELQQMAQRAGLALADEELRRLLPGVNRARKQVTELRELVTMRDEPAGIFTGWRGDQKK
ncbi:MAG: hypothetical protein ACREQO_18745 [Candidatus Binatia bacterium]